MPNFIDVEPIRTFARHAARRIAHPSVRERFERLAFERLLNDERNVRAARAHELDTAPDWARRASARGDAVVVFVLHRGAAQRIHTVARRLSDACLVAASDAAAHPGHGAYVTAARDFIEKFSRANFEVAARKALLFSRVRLAWDTDGDRELVCAAETVTATQGRAWTRIRSVAELRLVGREFRNCLARTGRACSYGGALSRGNGQFWVLRDAAGAGLLVAYAARVTPAHFSEVEGPRNTPVSHENPDLLLLAAALGMQPRTPPPGLPPAAATAAILRAWLSTPALEPGQHVELTANLPLRRMVATT